MPGIQIEASAAFDKVNALELPTAQAARRSADGHRVVATINGSTFGTSTSPIGGSALPLSFGLGLNVSDGELLTAGHPRHADVLMAFGIDASGHALIGEPTVELSVTLADGSVVFLSRVNQPRGPDEAVLFTSRFDTSTLTDDSGTEIVLTGIGAPIELGGTYTGQVGQVRRQMGNAPLASGTLVISAAGESAERIGASHRATR